MDPQTASRVVSSLKAGVAPHGSAAVALQVGMSDFWGKIGETEVTLAIRGNTGMIRYAMGEYGRGKTLFCNYLAEHLQSYGKGFVTSYIDVQGLEAIADLMGLYREMLRRLRAPGNEREGIEALLDLWVASVQTDARYDEFTRQVSLPASIHRKLELYRQYRRRSYQEAANTVTDWILGERDIPAERLRLIDEKGFSRLREDDVFPWWAAIKEIGVWLGYEGLLVMIDEAEDRKAGFDPKAVNRVLHNLLVIHNRLYQDPQFCRIVFVLAGTRDLWQDVIRLNEPVRQRYEARQCELPLLSEDEYIQLGTKVIEAYDVAMGVSLHSRISEADLRNLLETAVRVRGQLKGLTPRDFLFFLPTREKALFSQLEAMRGDPGLSFST